jgi:hypothetical protein
MCMHTELLSGSKIVCQTVNIMPSLQEKAQCFIGLLSWSQIITLKHIYTEENLHLLNWSMLEQK